jgi:hypothetical protein
MRSCITAAGSGRQAPKGTVVRGFLAVDTFSLVTDSGDELSTIPYGYEVG